MNCYKGNIITVNEKDEIPVFVDIHQHFASFSTFHAGLNVMEVESNAELLSMLREFVQKSSAKTREQR